MPQVSVEELLAQGEVALWTDSVTPASASVSDAGAVELGVKFRADTDGTINGIRFYKGSGRATARRAARGEQ